MLRRPRVGETEEEILKQQKEFEEQQNKGNTQDLQNTTVTQTSPAKSLVKTHNGEILGNIVERKHENYDFLCQDPPVVPEGFPSVFKIKACSTSKFVQKGQKRKSLFARQFERTEDNDVDIKEEFTGNGQADPSLQEIHEENETKLRRMAPEEILEEKRTLESTMDPSLLQFLKDRGSKKSVNFSNQKPQQTLKCDEIIIDENVIRENLDKTVDKEWLALDKIEPEKLQWIGDIPDAKLLESDAPYSARFDFSGNLQPFQKDVDVREALHHHGDEPERPGYTLQELYQLSRSSVLQQRIIALTTLGNIISKTKMGYYDSCFEGALLCKLVESDVFFLLRFAMDDRASTSAAVHCLYELFVNRSDEICLDRLHNVPGENAEPFLYVSVEVDKQSEEKEEELKDNELIAQDLIRGVLRTDLLVRFGYILNNFELDTVAIQKVFEIVTRVCRHSPDACQEVLKCISLIEYLFSYINLKPQAEAVKLIRVLANDDKSAKDLFELRKGDFNFIFKIIESDEPVFKLKLECLSLWNVMLRHGLLVDRFPWFSASMKRLLNFFASVVDVDHGRFDFELFSGITSVAITMAEVHFYYDSNFESSLLICLQKWMTQCMSGRGWNFSVSKALATGLHYLTVKFKNRGVTNEDAALLSGRFGQIVSAFLSSDVFGEMSDKLISHSHIRNFESPSRDPDSLPSLCSVYNNAGDYLKIVQDASAFPLVQSLTAFVLTASTIFPEEEKICNLMLGRFEKYRKEIMSSAPTSSWFGRIEASFLIDLFKLLIKIDKDAGVKFGFRLVSHLRTDDQRVVQVIEAITSISEFTEVADVYKQYVCKDFKPVAYHICENFPKHWIYEPISVAPKQTLKCVSYILDNCPDLIANVPPTLRYVHLCLVLLNDENVFNADISGGLEKCLNDVLLKFNRLDLNTIMISEKSFYELYRDLVTEYASSSYGHPLFAKVVTIPLAQKFDVSFRKLMWSEFMHALRVITLPANVPGFIPLDEFTSPVETDESLLILYLNAVSKNVLMEPRNGFIFEVAVTNIRKYLNSDARDENLANVLRRRVSALSNDDLKRRLLG